MSVGYVVCCTYVGREGLSSVPALANVEEGTISIS